MRLLRILLIVVTVVLAGLFIGRWTAPKAEPVVVEEKREFAVPPAPPKMAEKKERAVIIESPVDGSTIKGESFEVSGRARQTSEPLLVRALDEDGDVLVEKTITLPSSDSSFVRFAAEISFDETPEGPVTIEAVREDDDGEEVDSRIISFGEDELVSLKLFFRKTLGVGEDLACGESERVDRLVPLSGDIYEKALEELFEGPNEEERGEGLASAIPSRTELKSVAVDADGVVRADFKRLSLSILGECEAEAAVEQIKDTLGQFLEVREVELTVKGKDLE